MGEILIFELNELLCSGQTEQSEIPEVKKVVKFDVPTEPIQSQTKEGHNPEEIARDKLSSQATHNKVTEELDPRK